MDSHLLFWTFAFAVLVAAVSVALYGRRRARARDFAAHRRAMNRATALIVVFLAAYVGKVLVLGPDDLRLWPLWQVRVLRVHEFLMVATLLCGGAARLYSRRALAGGTPEIHRWLGRSTLISGASGLLTGTAVLLGMYQRAGLL